MRQEGLTKSAVALADKRMGLVATGIKPLYNCTAWTAVPLRRNMHLGQH